MAVSLDQFIKQLVASSLMSSDDVESLLAGIRTERRPDDGEQLARMLIKQKKLTKFQAEQLYAGKGKSLTLGNYTILDKLGQGGMGMVLKAEHRRMKRIVALKVMSPLAMKSPEAVKRFHREAQAAAKLDHPHIVAAYDADEANDTHFLVMQFVEGTDLSEVIKKHGPMPLTQAVDCIIQAARGLEFAHQQGVIHRDIKPANLLLDAKGTVKILDMGLARIDGAIGGSSEGAGLTNTGTIMGTVDYMSPEQAMDTKHADARSDIYSLGISLYYLLTGKVAYDGDTMMKKLMAHQNAPIPSLGSPVAPRQEGRTPSDSGSGLKTSGVAGDSALVSRSDTATWAAVDLVFRRMVAKRPGDRPQTMTVVIEELQRCLAGGSPTIAVDANAVAASSGSGTGTNVELQRFFQQLNDEANTSATSASPFGSKGTGVAARATDGDTTNSAAGEVGTDPHTERSLALEQSDRHRLGTSRGMAATIQTLASRKRLMASVAGIAVVLLVVLFVATRPSGKARVVYGDPNKKSLKSSRGETGSNSATTDIDWALSFTDVKNHVELPPLPLKFEAPFVIEAWVQRANRFDGEVWTLADFTPGPRLLFAPSTRDWHFGTWDLGHNDWVIVHEEYKKNPPLGKIQHVAGQWTGTEIQLFVDGMAETNNRVVQLNPAYVDEAAFNQARWKDLSEVKPIIGGVPDAKRPLKYAGGRVYSLRISNGLRYDQPFTPGKLMADPQTLALYDFEEGKGVVVKDSSGNNHHGQIIGAKWVRTDDESLPKSPTETALTLSNDNPDRRAARYVLWYGGTIKISEGDKVREINGVQNLPEGKFELTSVDTKQSPTVTDASLAVFKNCTHISFLNLHSAKMTDAGLAHFQNCKNLSELHLGVTQVSDAGLALFKDCDLTVLDLALTQVTDAGLAHFKDCKNLQQLGLHFTGVGDVGLAHLKDCHKLEGLTLTHTNVTDAGLDILKNWDQVKYVNLSQTQISDAGLVHLKGLEQLNLTATNVTAEGVKKLAITMPQCRIEWDGGVIEPPADPDRRVAKFILSVGGKIQLNDIPDFITEVRELPKTPFRLTSIAMDDNKHRVGTAGLAACRGCQNLTMLQLNKVAVGDLGFESFRQCKNLKILRVGYTNATDSNLACFRDCPDLTSLGLYEFNVSDVGLANFKQCKNLEDLDLVNVRVTDAALTMFEQCQNLQSFNTSGTDMGDAALVQMKRFPKLKRLTFANKHVTNAGLMSLPNLPDLETLGLAVTQVDDAGVKTIKKLTKLKHLDLRGTRVTSVGIAELKQALPDCKIDWDGAKPGA